MKKATCQAIIVKRQFEWYYFGSTACRWSYISKVLFLADKGYDSSDFVQLIEDSGGSAVIPPRSNARNPREYDKGMYKRRNLVERFFNRMKQFRRFATRYEKTAKSFLSLVHFVAVFVWIAISWL